MSKSRQNVNIELLPEVRERLESLRAWNGMTQKELVARVLSWFCDQDRVVQQAILGQFPEEVAPDVAVIMLERLAKQADANPEVESIPAPTAPTASTS